MRSSWDGNSWDTLLHTCSWGTKNTQKSLILQHASDDKSSSKMPKLVKLRSKIATRHYLLIYLGVNPVQKYVQFVQLIIFLISFFPNAISCCINQLEFWVGHRAAQSKLWIFEPTNRSRDTRKREIKNTTIHRLIEQTCCQVMNMEFVRDSHI